jgi:RNA polymerase sigma factor (sigma-70 family)
VAEDAVQEGLARAWERSERGEHIESLPGWVTRVALNLVRSRWRRLRREQPVQGDGLTEMYPIEDREEILDLRRALGVLPRRQKEVAVLHYMLGLDVVEVARTLGVREGTVKTFSGYLADLPEETRKKGSDPQKGPRKEEPRYRGDTRH